MFRTVPLSIIRSLSLYTQQWYVSYRFADSLLASCQQTGGWIYSEEIMQCAVTFCIQFVAIKAVFLINKTFKNWKKNVRVLCYNESDDLL